MKTYKNPIFKKVKKSLTGDLIFYLGVVFQSLFLLHSEILRYFYVKSYNMIAKFILIIDVLQTPSTISKLWIEF